MLRSTQHDMFHHVMLSGTKHLSPVEWNRCSNDGQ